MFTGWSDGENTFYDKVEITDDIRLDATFEDPTVVFGFNEDTTRDYGGTYITSYSGNAEHMKIPAIIAGNIIKGMTGEIFDDSHIKTLFLPMDMGIYGTPFNNSTIRRIEFYGDYLIPSERFVSKGEYEQILEDYPSECMIQDGATETSWQFGEGCPIIEVLSKTETMVVAGVEYYSLEVMVDQNFSYFGTATQINSYAFQEAYELEILEIPKGMDSFFNFTFEDTPNLHTLIIDESNEHMEVIDGVVYLEEMKTILFYLPGNTDKTFTVPDSVEVILDNAFLTTTHLEKIIIPNTFTRETNFYGLESLKEFEVLEGNETYRSVDGVLYTEDELVKYPPNKEGTKFTIPEGIVNVRSLAFMSVKNLEEITISSTVEELGRSLFWKSENITTLNIPSNVLYVHMGVVEESDIETIIINRDLTTDGSLTMAVYSLFTEDGKTTRTIYVPDSSLEAYKASDAWRFHVEDIKPISELD